MPEEACGLWLVAARLDADSWNSNCRCTLWNVCNYDGVSADRGVCAYPDRTQDLGACTHIDVPGQHRDAAFLSRADGHLLENEAVGADHCAGVDHDAVGMRQHQPAPYPGIHWDFGTGNGAPEPVPYQGPTASDPSQRCAVVTELLVVANCAEQPFAGRPFTRSNDFPGPIRNFAAHNAGGALRSPDVLSSTHPG
jgi:hypothetical protein